MTLLEVLLKDQPPMVKLLVGSLTALLPENSIGEIDAGFESLARDLYNNREALACNKMRALLLLLGMKPEDYKESA